VTAQQTPDPVAQEIRKVCQERGLYKAQMEQLLRAAKALWALLDEIDIDPNLGEETDRVFARWEFQDLRAAIAYAETAQPQGDQS
jgi:hypothetical protein